MWNNRRYTNQWSNQKDAALVAAALGLFGTLFIHYLTGKADENLLRALLTVAIMAIPALIATGFWVGTVQVRGYEKGVTEKMNRQQPYGTYIPPQNTAIPQLVQGVSHQEPIDATTT